MLVESAFLLLYLALLFAGAWCVSEGGDILGEKYDATIIGGFIIAWLNTGIVRIFRIVLLMIINQLLKQFFSLQHLRLEIQTLLLVLLVAV